MKYGVLLNKSNINIGDDIQAYATMQFLPRVDYFIDREHIDEFRPNDDEPVAVIMNAWYMWAKWNWPPSKYIVPKFVGFHYADHQLALQPGSPFKYEFLHGLGGDYLKAYEPIGARDVYTKDQLQSLGINSYVSGCITMTIPRMPETEDKGKYICIVDVEKRVLDKLKTLLTEKDIEVRIMTHNRERDKDMPWEKRQEIVENLLTTYQNARCVITRRLHCALPCLALGVPVYLIKEKEDDIRFSPYYDFLNRTTATKFLNDEYEYDFMNPLPNKEDFKALRDQLDSECRNFVAAMEQDSRTTAEEFCQTQFTEDELLKWRHDLMKKSMDEWLPIYRALQEKNTSLERKNKKLQKEVKSLKAKAAEEEEKKALKESEEKLKQSKAPERPTDRLKKLFGKRG